MTQLILASNSARRKQILKDHGFKFKALPANLDEDKYTNLPPLEMVKTLSLLKAKKIAKQNPNSVIIGADTTVVLKNKIIGKPKNTDDATKILNSLSNTKHEVVTGFTIINSDKKPLTQIEKTTIYFKKLSEKQINDYVSQVNVLGFAGAYGVQDKADKFVKKIDGDYLNIVGLPTKAIKELRKIL